MGLINASARQGRKGVCPKELARPGANLSINHWLKAVVQLFEYQVVLERSESFFKEYTEPLGAGRKRKYEFLKQVLYDSGQTHSSLKSVHGGCCTNDPSDLGHVMFLIFSPQG